METRNGQTNYRADDLTEAYCLALLQRAIIQDDHQARLECEQFFEETMRGWLHRHPLWETACQYGSEEYYLSLAFEQLQQSATRRLVASRTLSEALAYLRVSLHGVLLEMLRAHKRSETVSGQVKGLLPLASPQEFWEWLQRLLPDDREQRLFYLLYHCGLRPAEIVALSPQEWSDVREVIRLQTSILRRLQVLVPLDAA
jgi:integrase